MPTLQQVSPAFIVKMWPQVVTFIEKALELSAGEYTAEQLKAYLVEGLQALLVADDAGQIVGAATVAISNYPNDRIAFITALGGRGVANIDMLSQLEAWARANGCTRIRGAAIERTANLWGKKIGMREVYKIMEVKL